MNKNLLPIHSYKLTATRANLLGPNLYFLSFADIFWNIHFVQSIVLGTSCITPWNYVVYNQVGMAVKR